MTNNSRVPTVMRVEDALRFPDGKPPIALTREQFHALLPPQFRQARTPNTPVAIPNEPTTGDALARALRFS